MGPMDILYRIAVWDVDRLRREQEERDYTPAVNAGLQRWVAEAWPKNRWEARFIEPVTPEYPAGLRSLDDFATPLEMLSPAEVLKRHGHPS